MLDQNVTAAYLAKNGWDTQPLFAGSPALNGLSDDPFSCLPSDAELMILMNDGASIRTTAGSFMKEFDGRHAEVRVIFKKACVSLIYQPRVVKNFRQSARSS